MWFISIPVYENWNKVEASHLEQFWTIIINTAWKKKIILNFVNLSVFYIFLQDSSNRASKVGA